MTAVKILVKGWTGMQKSTLCNELLGLSYDDPDAFKIGEGADSVTSFTISKKGKFGDITLEIFDTPGDGETADRETNQRKQEITMLKAAGYFNAIIIVFNVNNSRLYEPQKIMLRKLKQLVQQPVLEHLGFVFTGIDSRWRERLNKSASDPRRDVCQKAVKELGGEGSECPLFSVDLHPPAFDKDSDNEIKRLLEWATTQSQFPTAHIKCPDTWHKEITITTRTDKKPIFVPNSNMTWEYVKCTAKVGLTAAAVVGCGHLIAGAWSLLTGGTVAVGGAAVGGATVGGAAVGGAAVGLANVAGVAGLAQVAGVAGGGLAGAAAGGAGLAGAAAAGGAGLAGAAAAAAGLTGAAAAGLADTAAEAGLAEESAAQGLGARLMSFYLPQWERPALLIQTIRVTTYVPWVGPPITMEQILDTTIQEL